MIISITPEKMRQIKADGEAIRNQLRRESLWSVVYYLSICGFMLFYPVNFFSIMNKPSSLITSLDEFNLYAVPILCLLMIFLAFRFNRMLRDANPTIMIQKEIEVYELCNNKRLNTVTLASGICNLRCNSPYSRKQEAFYRIMGTEVGLTYRDLVELRKNNSIKFI